MSTYMVDGKKMMNICILEILRKYTDSEHTMDQKDIIKKLETEYGMKVDRKSVKSNLMNLVDFGYNLECTEIERENKNGETEILTKDWYYNHEFDDAELRMLIDSILFSKTIPRNQAQELIEKIRQSRLPAILCINKIDTVAKKDDLLAVIAAYSEAYDFDGIFPISARTRDGLDELLDEFKKYAVEGPQLFPDGMTTDQPDRQVVGEIVREKLLRNLDKEIPHGTAVEITRFIERDDEVIEVDATIYCEKASHKGIIIGRGGEMLKRISSAARRDIEKFMGTKVYMETWVKVKENWRDNPNFIRSQGYNEE